MSLYRQLLLAIGLFLLAAFCGSFFVSLEQSRGQLLAQLQAHAQDAATALAVSLTPHLDDPAMREVLIESIFDSGYYESIRLVTIDQGTLLAERHMTQAAPAVPGWFAELVALQPQAGAATLMRGWQQAAQVQVLSYNGFAQARLWANVLGSLAWLCACGVISALAGGWLLRRQLRPLDQIAAQAQAIGQREFVTLPELPLTPELRQVGQAMNHMVEKLEQLFAEETARGDALRDQAFRDSLTGLANRRVFDTRLHDDLMPTEQNSPGYVLILRLNDLAGANQRLGSQHTDQLLCDVARLLEDQLSGVARSDWLATRNRGGEFALIAPVLTEPGARQLLNEMNTRLEQLFLTQASDRSPVAYMAMAAYTPGQSPASLLAQLDWLLTQAQATPEQPWAIAHETHALPARSGQDWRTWIDQALNERTLKLFFQPVVRCDQSRTLLHHKVLARLLDAEGQAVVAGRFLPWVERLGWAARFDLAMLDEVLESLKQRPRPLALSLSAASVFDESALAPLLHRLEQHTELGRWLTLEVDERKLPSAEQLRRLSHGLHRSGFRLGLQHFGSRFERIGHLPELGLAWLKVEGTYIRNLDQHADKRLFIEAITRAAHSIDLPVIAEMVETEAEFNQLHALGIQGAMGRWLGNPAPAP